MEDQEAIKAKRALILGSGDRLPAPCTKFSWVLCSLLDWQLSRLNGDCSNLIGYQLALLQIFYDEVRARIYLMLPEERRSLVEITTQKLKDFLQELYQDN